MRFSPKLVLGFLLAGAFLFNGYARAEETAATPTSTASDDKSFWGKVKKNGKASYVAEMVGMRTEALSGNGGPGKEGKGTAFAINHYASVGWKTGEFTSVRATQAVTQHVDEVPEARKKQFQPIDPYFTFSHGRLLHSDRYAATMSGYVRYYLPVSRNTHDAGNRGYLTAPDSLLGPNDIGWGQMRLLVGPSKSFLDGKLTINGTTFTNIKFAKLSPQERFDRQVAQVTRTRSSATPKSFREDIYVVFNPSIVYSVSSKVDVYTEWATLWRHSTNGRWTSTDDDDDGQYIASGVYWSPTKKVSVNPYVSYQLSAQDSLAATPQYKGLAHMDVGLTMQYTFL